MYGFKAGAAPKDKPKGEKIKGPGTGTSDSIKTKVPSGTYIMPADSTEQLGEKTLGELGKPVPVNLSNGEYQMPPEQVHAVGAQVLDQMKDATHTPVAAMGFKPQEGELYFADGGAVESTDDLIARISAKYGTGGGSSPRPQPTAAPAPQQPAQRLATPSIGSAADALRNRKRQIAEAAGFADGGLVDDERRRVPTSPAGIGFGDMRSPNIQRTGEPRQMPQGSPMQMPQMPTGTQGAPQAAQPQTQAGSFSSMQREPGIPRSGTPRQMPPGEPLGANDLPQGASRPNPIMQRPSEPGSFDSMKRAPIVTTSGTPRQMPQGDPLRPSDLAQGFVAGGNAATQRIAGGASAAARDFMAGGQAATEQIAGFGRKIASALAPQQEGSYSPEALGQPAPNPNAGAAWGAVKDALLYSSDAAAIRARNQQPTTTTTQAGAAQSAPAAPQPAIPAAAPQRQGAAPARAPAAPSAQGFNPSALTDQQRNDAGDAYRSAWQREAPSGMRGANDQALGFYNAEQQVRGTGITARRGANGVMEFSGAGEGALPQSYTQGFDMALGNERMASANATRQGMTAPESGQGYGFGRQGPSGGVIGDSSSAQRERKRLVDAASTPYRGAQNGQLTANQLRTLAGLQEMDQRATTEAANQQAATERAAMQEAGANTRAFSRDQIDSRRVASEERVRDYEARGLERVEKLYTAYENAKTPEERAAITEQIRAMNGKEAPNRYTVVPGGQEFDPTAGAAVTRPSRVFNNQTGQFVDNGGTPPTNSAPRAGEVRNGYRFKGGNPADRSAWENVKSK
ncbi:MAG: hypothetical protein RBS10_01510 [Thauera propionica]|jgi:hypothetical protein|nr:hypothetical protein [Thauera propionica]